MAAKISLEPLRGFRDLLPPESEELTTLAEIFADTARKHGYREVKPPTLERFELFALKSGEEIRNTMFTFKDKSGREVALRPEATASVARIYLRHLRGWPKPIRLYYIVNCFRYENPQRGRFREFWQAGVELIGAKDVSSDFEVIKLLYKYLEKVNAIHYVKIKIGNTRLYRRLFTIHGIPETVQDQILHYMDKKMYDKALMLARSSAKEPEKLTNVLKALWDEPTSLDAAVEAVKDIKPVREAVEELKILDKMVKAYGMKNVYYDVSFARGLAYYTGIIFEAEAQGFGFSIAGGGRYDGLIGLYGGEDVPGTGFAVGLDRLHYVLRETGTEIVAWRPAAKAAVVAVEQDLLGVAARIQDKLTSRGNVEAIIMFEKKLGKLIPKLLEQGYTHLVIVGPRELSENKVVVRDLRARRQEVVAIDDVEKYIS